MKTSEKTLAGEPVAAVVPIEDADPESLSLATNPDFMTIIERSRAQVPAGSGISTEEMRHRLGPCNDIEA